MSRYALQIQACHDDNERIYMSKGHHDPHGFMKALREYGADPSAYSKPTHHWVKQRPAPKNGDYSCLYHFVKEGTRGAFPATYTQEYGEDRYKDQNNE